MRDQDSGHKVGGIGHRISEFQDTGFQGFRTQGFNVSGHRVSGFMKGHRVSGYRVSAFDGDCSDLNTTGRKLYLFTSFLCRTDNRISL